MEVNGLFQKSKRGRSESISGRLRAASDLEEIGWIDKNQKGVIKDLIISGDETLRYALDKYENGDAHDLEALISRGMLAHRPSLDLLDGLDLDFLSVGYNGNGMLGGDVGQMGDNDAGGYSYEDDFLFDQGFDSTEAEDEAYHSDLFKLGAADRGDANWATQFRRSSLGGGSFDFTASFFEGLGPPPLPISRKHSLSLPPSTRPVQMHGGVGYGEVDLSAYQSMAASLQAQTEAHREKKNLKSPLKGLSTGTGAGTVAFDSTKKSMNKKKDSMIKNCSSSSDKIINNVTIKDENDGDNGSTVKTSPVIAPHLQLARRRPAGGIADTTNNYHQSADLPVLSQQQVQLQQARQQQLIQMQQNLITRQQQTQQFLQQQVRGTTKSPAIYPPTGTLRMHTIPEGAESHPHTQQQQPAAPTRERETSILRSLYNSDGTLCDTASIPLGGRGYVGAYSPEARRERIERFLAKRDKRVWTKKVKYDVRKNFADSRLRVKGRFVKKEDEELMKELLSI